MSSEPFVSWPHPSGVQVATSAAEDTLPTAASHDSNAGRWDAPRGAGSLEAAAATRCWPPSLQGTAQRGAESSGCAHVLTPDRAGSVGRGVPAAPPTGNPD